MKKLGEVEIIIRDFCPEAHLMSKDIIPYCQEYEAENSDEYISTTWKEYYPYPSYPSELEKQRSQKVKEEHYQSLPNMGFHLI